MTTLDLDIAAVVDKILENSKDADKPDRILKALEIKLLMLIAQNLGELNENLKKIEVDVTGLIEQRNRLGPFSW